MNQKMYLVTLKLAAGQNINAVRMLHAFFPKMELREAKEAIVSLAPSLPLGGKDVIVQIGVTAEEYASYWIRAQPNEFGRCRVTNIQPMEVPKFFRPR